MAILSESIFQVILEDIQFKISKDKYTFILILAFQITELKNAFKKRNKMRNFQNHFCKLFNN
jgi:hypothetical protein